MLKILILLSRGATLDGSTLQTGDKKVTSVHLSVTRWKFVKLPQPKQRPGPIPQVDGNYTIAFPTQRMEQGRKPLSMLTLMSISINQTVTKKTPVKLTAILSKMFLAALLNGTPTEAT